MSALSRASRRARRAERARFLSPVRLAWPWPVPEPRSGVRKLARDPLGRNDPKPSPRRSA